jgi:predicted ATPase/DNA-binding SARP family transcriptional activator
MPRLTVSLLGPFRASLDGEPLTGLESDKVRALLAFLMVESECPHRREELAGLLWPERAEAVARQDLSQALSNLRRITHDRTACPPFLNISRHEIGFNPASDYALDTLTFLSLLGGCANHLYHPQSYCPQCMANVAQAAELVVGPFLSGFSLKDCPAFEEWMLSRQERFQQLAVQALQRLSAWHGRCGGTEQAIAYTRRWLELDPWQERAHRQLMGLLARSGQRNAALEQYEVCRAVLARELGIEPEAETQRLYAAIREGSLAAGSAALPTTLEMPALMLPLLGREDELAEIEACLKEPDCRLLSLVGAGGSGKTHLALEAATRQGDGYADGVTMVGLAAVQAAEAVVPAIAQACGLRLQPEQPARRQLLDYLRGKELLLVLDNLEHLLATPPSGQGNLAELLLDILRSAPRVWILTTSRVRLNLMGEHLLHVGGLPTPGPDEEGAALASYPAVQLFLSTARRVRSAYAPDDEELRTIAALCHLLDGMPLAILLAASWMEVLGPAEILEQVRQRYDFLEVEWQDLPPRQRSVRAVLDHSWGLLSGREQQLFPRLSIFCGGFTAAAADQVAGVSWGDLLRLAGKSFLVRMPGGRFELHELLRQYGEDKLAQGADAAREQHSVYYLALAQKRGEELKGPRQQEAFAELEAEGENLRAAWEWAVMRGEVARLGQAVDGLCRLFEWRGRCEEGVALCGVAVERLGSVVHDEERCLWARLLAWQGLFERMAGRTERADRLAEQSLGILEQLAGDVRSERAFALRVGGEAAFWLGQCGRAEDLYRQSLALCQQLNDPWNGACVQYHLGWLCHRRGQSEDAARWLEASLQLRRAAGDWASSAQTLLKLGSLIGYMGDLAQAERSGREAIGIYRKMADQVGMAKGSHMVASLLVFSGRFSEAEALFEDESRYLRRLGQRSDLSYALEHLHWARMCLGKYESAREPLEAATAIFQESSDPMGMAYVHLERAHFALLEGAGVISRASIQASPETLFEEAYCCAGQALAAFGALGADDQGLAWAELGFAAHCLGRHAEARRHLGQALRTANRALQTTVSALACLAAILADDEPERAVELYALASRHPYIGNSRLWQDLLAPRITAAAGRLPPDVVVAAQARGREGDWMAATESWLKELE